VSGHRRVSPASGQLVTRAINAAGSRTTNTWDIENMMTQAALPDGSNTTFTYDGDKRRRSKGESGAVTKFVRDGERVLVETDAGGTTQTRYTTVGGGWFDRLVSLRRSGASRFYHLDALGSADRLTDASQAVTDSYLHKAFGILVTSTGSTVNPFRFAAAYGYYRDSSTGLMQLGVRYYRDAMGRFVSRDPMGPGRGGYAYVGNRCLRLVDPSGRWATFMAGFCGPQRCCATHAHCLGLMGKAEDALRDLVPVPDVTNLTYAKCQRLNHLLYDICHQCQCYEDIEQRWVQVAILYHAYCTPKPPRPNPCAGGASGGKQWEWPPWLPKPDPDVVALCSAFCGLSCRYVVDLKLKLLCFCACMADCVLWGP